MEPTATNQPSPSPAERVHVTRSRAKPGGRTMEGGLPFRERKPPWLKVPAPGGPTYRKLKQAIEADNLHTVCEEAACPNVGECWERGTATFMILGDVCTRACAYCNVRHGAPGPLDADEPRKVASAVAAMQLQYVVITSVDRDDLPDGGSETFVSVIREIRDASPSTRVEVLIPDFQGREDQLRTVLDAKPDVLNHNIETVPRLYRIARPGGKYARALELLDRARTIAPAIPTKSGLMVGLGEDYAEVLETIADLRKVDCRILTIGQYLRPSDAHLPMARYYTPAEFAELKAHALGLGFGHVESGPLVRSSYHAHEQTEAYELNTR